jgi:hypothetical protein
MVVIKLALHTSTHCERAHGALLVIVAAIIILRRRSRKKVEDEYLVEKIAPGLDSYFFKSSTSFSEPWR